MFFKGSQRGSMGGQRSGNHDQLSVKQVYIFFLLFFFIFNKVTIIKKGKFLCNCAHFFYSLWYSELQRTFFALFCTKRTLCSTIFINALPERRLGAFVHESTNARFFLRFSQGGASVKSWGGRGLSPAGLRLCKTITTPLTCNHLNHTTCLQEFSVPSDSTPSTRPSFAPGSNNRPGSPSASPRAMT